MKYRPYDVVYTLIIKDAAERGVRYFDFSMSGGQEGVARYKAQFGTERWPLRKWTFRPLGRVGLWVEVVRRNRGIREILENGVRQVFSGRPDPASGAEDD